MLLSNFYWDLIFPDHFTVASLWEMESRLLYLANNWKVKSLWEASHTGHVDLFLQLYQVYYSRLGSLGTGSMIRHDNGDYI